MQRTRSPQHEKWTTFEDDVPSFTVTSSYYNIWVIQALKCRTGRILRKINIIYFIPEDANLIILFYEAQMKTH